MKVVPFIAENAAAALAKIHSDLGPDAIVLSVRPLPRHGLARLWPRTGPVEVLAGVLDEHDQSSPSSHHRPADEAGSGFGLGRFFQNTKRATALHDGTSRPHVFIGPPGVGKTTLLCKWMAFSVLNESRTAKVWRLDGANANTAEFLNIYGEMLAVSVERFWGAAPPVADLCLIDLPGVSAFDTDGLHALKDQLATLPAPRIHLVLNASYDTVVLNEQFSAFSRFQPEDVSLCHLDEEKRQGKLTDFLLGTNCCVRFLSTGQKIPGDFVVADEVNRVYPAFAG
jgi:flagellar biosynthesis GTPase FlhF